MSYILSCVSSYDSLKFFSLCVIIKCIKMKFESIHIKTKISNKLLARYSDVSSYYLIWACSTIGYPDLLSFYYQLKKLSIFGPNYHCHHYTTKFKILAADRCLIWNYSAPDIVSYRF
jgi:hypothetical protein